MVKKYIQLRYEWMPQLYSLFHEASKTGLPIMRPLLLEYPEDEKTYNLHDQFMIGNNVVVAPILTPGITDRAVYLPAGEWVEQSTGKSYEGEKVHLIHAELDELPIFVKKGTAIFQSKWVSNKEKTPKQVTMHLYPGDNREVYDFTFYDDDGETFAYEKGEYLEIKGEVRSTEDSVHITVTEQNGHFKPL